VEIVRNMLAEQITAMHKIVLVNLIVTHISYIQPKIQPTFNLSTVELAQAHPKYFFVVRNAFNEFCTSLVRPAIVLN
jgi:hypothetical protein